MWRFVFKKPLHYILRAIRLGRFRSLFGWEFRELRGFKLRAQGCSGLSGLKYVEFVVGIFWVWGFGLRVLLLSECSNV